MGRARTQGGGILCLPFLITRSPDFLLFSVSPCLRGETSVGDVARSRRCQRSSLPLSFRAPSEFRNAERRQERNPEDVFVQPYRRWEFRRCSLPLTSCFFPSFARGLPIAGWSFQSDRPSDC